MAGVMVREVVWAKESVILLPEISFSIHDNFKKEDNFAECRRTV